MVIGSTFEAVGVIVTDMERSLEFYGLLGLNFDRAFESVGMVEVTLPSGMRMMFSTEDRMKKIDPNYEPPPPHGRVSLAFRCASPVEVDALHGAVVEAGFESHMAPFDVFWGHRYAALTDPDGVRIDLFARLEEAS